MTKVESLLHDNLTPALYMTNKMFSRKEAALLFSLRTRTVRGVRSDFGKMYTSKVCPLKGTCTHLDTLPAMLTCQVLRARASGTLYSDVFSTSLEQQKKVTMLYSRILELREEILNPPAEEAGPMHYLQNPYLDT